MVANTVNRQRLPEDRDHDFENKRMVRRRQRGRSVLLAKYSSPFTPPGRPLFVGRSMDPLANRIGWSHNAWPLYLFKRRDVRPSNAASRGLRSVPEADRRPICVSTGKGLCDGFEPLAGT